MLDKPEKNRQLMVTLDAAVPFEVALLPEFIQQLAQQQRPVSVKPIETVSKISYLGDMGGIICHIEPEDTESMVVVPSLMCACLARSPSQQPCSTIRSIG